MVLNDFASGRNQMSSRKPEQVYLKTEYIVDDDISDGNMEVTYDESILEEVTGNQSDNEEFNISQMPIVTDITDSNKTQLQTNVGQTIQVQPDYNGQYMINLGGMKFVQVPKEGENPAVKVDSPEAFKRRDTSEFRIWSSDSTKLLIDLYKKYRSKVGSSKIKTWKRCFEIIADEINAKDSEMNVQGCHCENRWKLLERNYKKYLTGNGRARKYFEYVEEFDAIKKHNPYLLLVKKANVSQTEEPQQQTSINLNTNNTLNNIRNNTNHRTQALISNNYRIINPQIVTNPIITNTEDSRMVEVIESIPVVNVTPKVEEIEKEVRNTKAVVRRPKRRNILANLRRDRLRYYKQKIQIEKTKIEIEKEKISIMKYKNQLLNERNDILNRWCRNKEYMS